VKTTMKNLRKTIRKVILESYSGTVYGRPLPKDQNDESLWHQFQDWLYGDDRADGKLSVSAKYNKRSPSLKKVIDALNAARHDTDRDDLINFLNDINMQYVRGKGKVLFENKNHYEKLATMLCTGNIESVRQAIELAETLGYIHQLEYSTSPLSSRSDFRPDQIVHRWSFSVVPDFKDIIDIEWDNTPSHNRRFGTFVVYPIRNHSIGIKLVETTE